MSLVNKLGSERVSLWYLSKYIGAEHFKILQCHWFMFYWFVEFCVINLRLFLWTIDLKKGSAVMNFLVAQLLYYYKCPSVYPSVRSFVCQLSLGWTDIIFWCRFISSMSNYFIPFYMPHSVDNATNDNFISVEIWTTESWTFLWFKSIYSLDLC